MSIPDIRARFVLSDSSGSVFSNIAQKTKYLDDQMKKAAEAARILGASFKGSVEDIEMTGTELESLGDKVSKVQRSLADRALFGKVADTSAFRRLRDDIETVERAIKAVGDQTGVLGSMLQRLKGERLEMFKQGEEDRLRKSTDAARKLDNSLMELASTYDRVAAAELRYRRQMADVEMLSRAATTREQREILESYSQNAKREFNQVRLEETFGPMVKKQAEEEELMRKQQLQAQQIRERANPRLRLDREYKEDLAELDKLLKNSAISAEDHSSAVKDLERRYIYAGKQLEGYEKALNQTSNTTRKYNPYAAGLTANIINVGNAAIASRGDLISMASPLLDVAQGFGASLKQILLWGGAIGAVIGTVALFTSRSMSLSKEVRELEVRLQAIGRVGQVSARALQDNARGIADTGAVGRGDAFEATRILGTTRFNLNPEQVKNLTMLSIDLSKALGVDTANAAKTLASALENPASAADKLNEELNFLSAGQLTLIKNLQDSGDKAGALEVVLRALEERVGGLTTKANSQFSVAWRKFASAFGGFVDQVANSKQVTGTLTDIAAALERIADAGKNGFGHGLTQSLAEIADGFTNVFQGIGRAPFQALGIMPRGGKNGKQPALSDLPSGRGIVAQMQQNNSSMLAGSVAEQSRLSLAPSNANTPSSAELKKAYDETKRDIDKRRDDLLKEIHRFEGAAFKEAFEQSYPGQYEKRISDLKRQLQAVEDLGQAAKAQADIEVRVLRAPIAQRSVLRAQLEAERYARLNITDQAERDAYVSAQIVRAKEQEIASSRDLSDRIAMETKAQENLSKAVRTSEAAALRQEAVNQALSQAFNNASVSVSALTQEYLRQKEALASIDASKQIRELTLQAEAAERLAAAAGVSANAMSAASREAEALQFARSRRAPAEAMNDGPEKVAAMMRAEQDIAEFRSIQARRAAAETKEYYSTQERGMKTAISLAQAEFRLMGATSIEREAAIAYMQKENELRESGKGLTEEQIAQLARLSAEQAKINATVQAARQVYEETRTPLEQYYKKMEELNALEKAGAIDADTAARARIKANQDMFGELEKIFSNTASAFDEAFDGILDGTKSFRESMSNIFKAMGKDLMKNVLQENLFNPLKGWIIGQATGQASPFLTPQQSAGQMPGLFGSILQGTLGLGPEQGQGQQRGQGGPYLVPGYAGGGYGQLPPMPGGAGGGGFFSNLFSGFGLFGGGSGGGLLSGIGDMFSGLFGSLFGGGKATGGSVSAGRGYMVGEQGPELFRPSVSGQIIPLGDLGLGSVFGGGQLGDRGALAGAGGTKMLQDAMARMNGLPMGQWSQARVVSQSGGGKGGGIFGMLSGLLGPLMGAFGGFEGIFNGIGDMFSGLTNGFYGGYPIVSLGRNLELFGRAYGGPVSAGVPYMTGEIGPELFVPSGGGLFGGIGNFFSGLFGGNSGGGMMSSLFGGDSMLTGLLGGKGLLGSFVRGFLGAGGSNSGWMGLLNSSGLLKGVGGGLAGMLSGQGLDLGGFNFMDAIGGMAGNFLGNRMAKKKGGKGILQQFLGDGLMGTAASMLFGGGNPMIGMGIDLLGGRGAILSALFGEGKPFGTLGGMVGGGGFLDDILGIKGGQQRSLFSVVSNFAGFRADGGMVQPGKAYMTGEEGPELFVPSSAGSIATARETAAMGRSSGGRNISIVQNFPKGTDERIVRSAAQSAARAVRMTEFGQRNL
jgi:hypothetical protein